MTEERYEDYELGRDVTEAATRGDSKSRGTTAVLSVRVSADELADVEAVGRATGKSVSQVVRDAMREHLHHERFGGIFATISYPGGVMVTMGAGIREVSRASHALTEEVPFVRAS